MIALFSLHASTCRLQIMEGISKQQIPGRSDFSFFFFLKIKVVSSANPLQYSAAAALAVVKEVVQI